jgi:hypothetical protein
MTFLQPFILWALPLVLLPVIIHLINRLRHRPQPWGAMMFLLAANRASTSHAKLRQLLILLFRCLAVLALVLFVSRPLAGGWLGWALSPAPDVILIVLDRSASMEEKPPGATATKREQALRMIGEAAREFQDRSHLVLLDSATRAAQPIASATALEQPALTGPTDTTADLPALLQSAHQWLVENRAGTAEIWIASDLQRGDWHPGDDRWQSAVAQLAALPQRVRVRLLALNQPADANASASLAESLFKSAPVPELHLALDLHRAISNPSQMPLTLNLNGAATQQELALEGATVRWRQRIALGEAQKSGWGSAALPADANPRDNTAFFVYGGDTAPRTLVISADAGAVRIIRLAGISSDDGKPADLIAPAELANASFANYSLIAWQGALPDSSFAPRLQSFVEEGGVVLFLPDGEASESKFAGVGWGELQKAAAETPFKMKSWEEADGPLAKTDEGLSLPVDELAAVQRRGITGEVAKLAVFADGSALLARQTLGRGAVYFCATPAQDEWSNLGDGPVLVPMMQRLMLAGARRLNQESALVCGELAAADRQRDWTSVDAEGKNIRLHAGVYRSGDRLVAVNRPPGEDEPGRLDAPEAKALFGALPLQMLEEKRGGLGEALQGEIWRLFVFGMLAFLLVESFLILPAKAVEVPLKTAGVRTRQAELEEVA